MSCGRKQPLGEAPGFQKAPPPPPPPAPQDPFVTGPVLIQLTCIGCGWTVAGLMGGTHGTSPEQARRDLVRALRWSHDGTRCGYCRTAQPALLDGRQQKEGAYVVTISG